jgi:hypothetical protein
VHRIRPARNHFLLQPPISSHPAGNALAGLSASEPAAVPDSILVFRGNHLQKLIALVHHPIIPK